MIPRILHQTWKDAEVPERWRPLVRSWRDRHPDWEYRLWTDADLRGLIEQHYPWFLSQFDGYSHAICRVDAGRYFVMHHHGGVYADLDFECLRPIGPLLEGRELIFGVEPASHLGLALAVRRRPRLRRVVCNAFIASAPGHPFWGSLFEAMVRHVGAVDVLDATGPFLLTDAIGAFPEPGRIRIEPSESLYPMDKMQVEAGALSQEAGRAGIPPEAFAVHHWAGEWIQGFQEDVARMRAEPRESVEAISSDPDSRI